MMTEHFSGDVTYTGGLAGTYMVIRSEGDSELSEFDIKMLKSSSIPQLLRFDMQQIDSETSFLYDISGKQAFSKVFELRKMSFTDLKNFLTSLSELSAELSEYLLPDDHILFLPECIFTDHERNIFFFCLFPGICPDTAESITSLFNDFLGLIDYNDKDAVELAYSLTRLCSQGIFSLTEVEKLVGNTDSVSSESDPNEYNLYERSSIPQEHDGSINHNNQTLQDQNADMTGVYGQDSPGKNEKKDSFRDKARRYFKSHGFSEVFDDINSGKIIRKIREEPSKEAPFSVSDDTVWSYPGASDANTEDNTASSISSFPRFSAEELSPPVYEEYTLGNLDSIFMEDTPYGISADTDEADSRTMQLDINLPDARKLSGTGQSEGVETRLDEFPFTIGKSSAGCTLHLDDPAISRIHCRIYKDPDAEGEYLIEDENSTNGTFLNGMRLDPYSKHPLHIGDLLKVARCEFYFL